MADTTPIPFAPGSANGSIIDGRQADKTRE
jgi:hypothetical protein